MKVFWNSDIELPAESHLWLRKGHLMLFHCLHGDFQGLLSILGGLLQTISSSDDTGKVGKPHGKVSRFSIWNHSYLIAQETYLVGLFHSISPPPKS